MLQEVLGYCTSATHNVTTLDKPQNQVIFYLKLDSILHAQFLNKIFHKKMFTCMVLNYKTISYTIWRQKKY